MSDVNDGGKSRERVAFLRARLALAPHPEGGLFREHYRGQESARGSSSAIYFLMPEGSCSAWHRVNQDELWHHYEGAPVELHLIDDPEGLENREGLQGRGGYRVLRIGPLGDDTLPCAVAPAGVWQAARPLGGYALVGNTVAPGFQFSDWALADAATLRALAMRHPEARLALAELSRDVR